MMDTWAGMLAPLGEWSSDDRALAAVIEPRTRPLPLPLTNEDGRTIGRIDRVWTEGNQLHATGHSTPGLLEPDTRYPVGVSVDDAEAQQAGGRRLLFTSWRLMGAMVYSTLTPAFPSARIRLAQR